MNPSIGVPFISHTDFFALDKIGQFSMEKFSLAVFTPLSAVFWTGRESVPFLKSWWDETGQGLVWKYGTGDPLEETAERDLVRLNETWREKEGSYFGRSGRDPVLSLEKRRGRDGMGSLSHFVPSHTVPQVFCGSMLCPGSFIGFPTAAANDMRMLVGVRGYVCWCNLRILKSTSSRRFLLPPHFLRKRTYLDSIETKSTVMNHPCQYSLRMHDRMNPDQRVWWNRYFELRRKRRAVLYD